MCPGSLALAPFSLSSCVGFRSWRSVLFKFRQNRNYPQVCPWIKKRSGRQDVNDLLHVNKRVVCGFGRRYLRDLVGRAKGFQLRKRRVVPSGSRGGCEKLSARAARFFYMASFFGADHAKKIWKRRLLDEVATLWGRSLKAKGPFGGKTPSLAS